MSEQRVDTPETARREMGLSVGRTGTSVMSDTNVTPMIDVLLVLLVIFILVQMNLQRTFDLQLPVEPREGITTPAIVLEIDAAGAAAVNRQPIAAAALSAFLRSVYATRPDKVIYVKASSAVEYGKVIEFIDVARGAGVRVVGAVLGQNQ